MVRHLKWSLPFLILAGWVFLASCKQESAMPEAPVEEASSPLAFLEPVLSPPPRDPSEGFEFVGATSCQACHEQEHADWKESHHYEAMAHATEETVLGDFDDAEFEHFGHRTRFFRRDGGFWVNTEGRDGQRQDFEVTYTFGVYPLQQYLIPFPGGRLQALQICWDARPETEGGQRWYHLYPDEEVPPDDVLHWTRRHFNWNYMCADCHSTNLVKNYDVTELAYETSWSEINVSCESCHGPGSEHVAWAESYEEGGEKGDLGLLVRLKEPEPGAWTIDVETMKPVRTKPLESQAQLETCAPCHAHRTPLQTERLFGQRFLDSYLPSALDRVHYHGDGQIKEEVYVYGSFVQSKMHHAGVRCTDCHHPHTMRIHAPGNALCARCHVPAKYDTPDHHFHAPESTGASCVECHMPPKYYMVADKRRDHSIRIPRPDLSKTYGTPNACNTCHTDQNAAWAAAAFESWWGKKPRPGYGEMLTKGRRDVSVWEKELLRLVRQDEMPGIARASALQLLSEELSPAGLEALREAVTDPDPLTRHHAISALDVLPPAQRLEVGLKGLRDPIRAVRVEAARVLAEVPRKLVPEADREMLDSAIAEYMEMQAAVADTPESHINLALMHQRMGDLDQAEADYQTALRVDPDHVPARINYAELLYESGRLDEAGPLLEEAVEREPESGYAHEALGRHHIRQKSYEEGLKHLIRAVELMPDRADLYYFVGVGLNSVGRFDDALPYLRKAIELDPDNQEYLSGTAAICRDAGRMDMAQEFLNRLRR